jgi:hypothetical protein
MQWLPMSVLCPRRCDDVLIVIPHGAAPCRGRGLTLEGENRKEKAQR